MANYRYKKTADQMKANIEDGTWPYGSRIPSEEKLREMYDCSRVTIRQALDVLLEEGLIYKVRGSGTYIKKPVHEPSYTIAVITTYISEYIFPSILHAIEDCMEEQGYSVIIKTTKNSIARERKILKELKDKNVDGIIVEGTKTAFPNPNVSFYEEIAEADIPVVFFNGYYENISSPRISYVVVDDYNGGWTSVKKLHELGHTKIGGIFKADDMQGLRRFSGFVDALIAYDCELDDDKISWFRTETRKTFLRDLSTETRKAMSDCTALVVYNDIAAEVVLKKIKEYFPSVTMVFSFDKKYFLDPPDGVEVMSLDHPKGKIGETAAQKLLSMLNGNKEESTTMDWDASSL